MTQPENSWLSEFAERVDEKLKTQRCDIVIPGIGQCEEKVAGHPADEQKRLVHRVGPVTWNGEILIEVEGL